MSSKFESMFASQILKKEGAIAEPVASPLIGQAVETPTASSIGSRSATSPAYPTAQDYPVAPGPFVPVQEVFAEHPTLTVAIDRIEPNPEQPRKDFDEQALQELAENITALGLLQPIVVRSHPNGISGRYQILAGERRWRASKRASLAEVPIVIREVDDRGAMEIGLAENLMRDDLNPLEEAEMMQLMIERFHYTYEQLAERLGKRKNYIWHRTNLLKLPEDVRTALTARNARESSTETSGKAPHENFIFSPGHAEAVGQIVEPQLRAEILQVIFDEALSVAETRRRVKLIGEIEQRFADKRSRDRMTHAVVQKGISTTEFIKRASRMKDRIIEAPKSQAGVWFPVDGLAVLQYFRMREQEADHSQVDAAELIAILQSDLKRLRAALIN